MIKKARRLIHASLITPHQQDDWSQFLTVNLSHSVKNTTWYTNRGKVYVGAVGRNGAGDEHDNYAVFVGSMVFGPI